MRKIPLVVILSALVVASAVAADTVVAGYYASWAQYRSFCQKYEQLDPTGYTHVILAFAKITDAYEPVLFDEWGDPMVYDQLKEAKLKHPGLKVIVAFGGWTFCQEVPTCYIFPTMSASATHRQHFAQALIKFLRGYGFDGIDIDWEYPEICGSRADQDNYVLLARDLREAFIAEAAATGNERLLITLALPVPYGHPNMKYKELSEEVDWINLMTYDLVGSWSGYTGFHTALNPPGVGEWWAQALNVRDQVQTLFDKGVSRDKIVVGLGFYARSWTLTDLTNTGPGSKTWRPGKPGWCLFESGAVAWFEIAEFIRQGGWVVRSDPTSLCTYCYKGDQWYGYDDPDAIRLKGQFIRSEGLRGAMTWTMDYDDANRTLSKAMVESVTGAPPGPTPGVTYAWAAEAYGPCSGECDKGTQTRKVTCERTEIVGGNTALTTVPDAQCVMAGLVKPASSQACTLLTSKCGANTACVNNRCVCLAGYSGNPLIGCVKGAATCAFTTGPWSVCVGECDKGTQTRIVTCEKTDAVTGVKTAVSDAECVADGVTKPHTSQACVLTSSKCGANTVCSLNKCACLPGFEGNPLTGCTKSTGGEEFEWLPSEWSTCSGFCGFGTQYRQLSCVRSSDKRAALWSDCVGIPQPDQSRTCKLPNACPCTTHCDCITWDNPNDFDPMCYNHECMLVPEVCALLKQERSDRSSIYGAPAVPETKVVPSVARRAMASVKQSAASVGKKAGDVTKKAVSWWPVAAIGGAVFAVVSVAVAGAYYGGILNLGHVRREMTRVPQLDLEEDPEVLGSPGQGTVREAIADAGVGKSPQ